MSVEYQKLLTTTIRSKIEVSKQTNDKTDTERGDIFMCIYGYCRISTNQQSIDRQIRNIKSSYDKAVIILGRVYNGLLPFVFVLNIMPWGFYRETPHRGS